MYVLIFNSKPSKTFSLDSHTLIAVLRIANIASSYLISWREFEQPAGNTLKISKVRTKEKASYINNWPIWRIKMTNKKRQLEELIINLSALPYICKTIIQIPNWFLPFNTYYCFSFQFGYLPYTFLLNIWVH